MSIIPKLIPTSIFYPPKLTHGKNKKEKSYGAHTCIITTKFSTLNTVRSEDPMWWP